MNAEPKTVGEIVDQLPPLRAVPATVEPRAAVTPMQMLQIAIERGSDVAMLEKLMALQERWEASEARKAFVAALSAFKAAPPKVVKNKHVRFDSKGPGGKTEYDHATLDQVCDVIGGALSQHGLSHRWEVDQAEGIISVTCVLTHVQGHSERVTLRAGADQSGGKNNIQAVGSTVSYLERYTLLAATGLAASDQDDDARSAEVETISEEQKAVLVGLMKESNADTIKFLAFFGIKTLDEMPAPRFAEARRILEQKKAAAGGAGKRDGGR